MIALNKNKPTSCLFCPCLSSFRNVSSENKNKTYAIQYCAAAYKEICIYEELEDTPLPDSFYYFPIPQWCPWIEINNSTRDEESYWHMSMAGLGGSYEY